MQRRTLVFVALLAAVAAASLFAGADGAGLKRPKDVEDRVAETCNSTCVKSCNATFNEFNDWFKDMSDKDEKNCDVCAVTYYAQVRLTIETGAKVRAKRTAWGGSEAVRSGKAPRVPALMCTASQPAWLPAAMPCQNNSPDSCRISTSTSASARARRWSSSARSRPIWRSHLTRTAHSAAWTGRWT